MKEGDDLAALAAAAVSMGADVIGMAGGDGSQAIVAAVAAAHDIPFVCVPAGTRNHFALDIGVDRQDLIGALDAFHLGSERRIDLAQVNGRVFVNNASIGFYGEIVQSPEYRDAKLRTVIEMLPDLLGPDATHFDLRFTDPSGAEFRGAQLVLVSNNRYQLDPLAGKGTRGKMDDGTLAWSSCPKDRRYAPSGNGSPLASTSTPGPPSTPDSTARPSHSSHPSDSNRSPPPCASGLQRPGVTSEPNLDENPLSRRPHSLLLLVD